MYRLQVKFCGKWKWGIQEYDSKEEAERRVEYLKTVGIKARVKLAAELFK